LYSSFITKRPACHNNQASRNKLNTWADQVQFAVHHQANVLLLSDCTDISKNESSR